MGTGAQNASAKKPTRTLITSEIPKTTSPVDLFYAQANWHEVKIDTMQGGQNETVVVDSGALASRLAQSIVAKFQDTERNTRVPDARLAEILGPYRNESGHTHERVIEETLEIEFETIQDVREALKRGLEKVKKYCQAVFLQAREPSAPGQQAVSAKTGLPQDERRTESVKKIVNEFLAKRNFHLPQWEMASNGTLQRTCYFVTSTQNNTLCQGVRVFGEPISRDQVIEMLGGRQIAANLEVSFIEHENTVYGCTFKKDPEDIVRTGFHEPWWSFVARGEPASLHKNLRGVITAKNPNYSRVFYECAKAHKAYVKSLAKNGTNWVNDCRARKQILPIEALERIALDCSHSTIHDIASKEDLVTFETILRNPNYPASFARQIREKMILYAVAGGDEEVKKTCLAILKLLEPDTAGERFRQILHLATLVVLYGDSQIKMAEADVEGVVWGDYRGRTLVHWASTIGSLPIVRYLIEHGVDKNSHDNNEKSALHYACGKGHLPLVRYLLKHGCNIHARDEGGDTVLHAACKSGSLPLVQYLLKEGIDKHVRNDNGATILHAACASGSLPLVQYLLKAGLDKNACDDDGWSIVHSACESGSLPLVEFLVHEGLDIHVHDQDDVTILHTAIESGSLPLIKYLVGLGLDIRLENENGISAFNLAHTTGLVPVVRYLATQGVVIGDQDEARLSFLFCAARSGSVPLLEHLVRQGIDMCSSPQAVKTMFVFACTSGSISLVSYLLAQGFAKSLDSTAKKDIFVDACGTGLVALIEPLARHGFIQALREVERAEALHAAYSSGSVPLVGYFLECGFDINARDSSVRTILQKACGGGHLGLVQYLCEHGAEKNILDDSGQTLLHIASSEGNIEIVRYLVQIGLGNELLSNEGLAPIDLACRAGKVEIVDFLLEKGVPISHLASGANPLFLELYSESELDESDVDPRERAFFFHILGKLSPEQLNLADDEGEALVHKAVKEQDAQLVEWLTATAGVVLTKNHTLKTPFTIACELYAELVAYGHAAGESEKIQKIIHCFLKHQPALGLEELVACYEGETLLHLGAKAGDIDTVRALVENKKVPLDTHNKAGFTPFALAVENHHLEIAALLASRGVKLYAPTPSGTTFHTALRMKNKELVEKIIQCNVAWDVRDSAGDTPLHLVVRSMCTIDRVTLALQQKEWKKLASGVNNALKAAFWQVFQNVGFEEASRVVALLLEKLHLSPVPGPRSWTCEADVFRDIPVEKGNRNARFELAVLLGDSRMARNIAGSNQGFDSLLQELARDYSERFLKIFRDSGLRVRLEAPSGDDKEALSRIFRQMPPNPPRVTREKLKHLFRGENYVDPAKDHFVNPVTAFSEIEVESDEILPGVKFDDAAKRQAVVHGAKKAILTFWKEITKERVFGLKPGSLVYNEMRERFAWIVDSLLKRGERGDCADLALRRYVVAEIVNAGTKCGPRKYNTLLDSYRALCTPIEDFRSVVLAEKMQIFKYTMMSFVPSKDSQNVHGYIKIAQKAAEKDPRFTTPEAYQLLSFQDQFSSKEEIAIDAIITQLELEYTPTELLDRLCLRYADDPRCRQLFDSLQFDAILPKLAAQKWGKNWEMAVAKEQGFSGENLFFQDWARKNLGKNWKEEVNADPRFQAGRLPKGISPHDAYVKEQFLRSQFDEYLSGLYSFENDQPQVSRSAMRDALVELSFLEKI